MKKPLIDKIYTIDKFPGKGGWYFVVIKGIPASKKGKGGMVRVTGTIDDFAIEKYNLMPMREGDLFLPIRAEIRKLLKKKEGDKIHILLHEDNLPLTIPNELQLCFEDEPMAFTFYNSLTDAEQKQYLDWIYSAKKEETRINRMADAINKLLRKEKLYGIY
ncbi:MAG: YdeI/OmpD-associated family protein [Bacteroidota bacterium]